MGDTQTSEWIEHDGKGIPVSVSDRVRVKFRDGFGSGESAHRASYWLADKSDARDYWTWEPKKPEGDIIAYCVVKP